MFIRSQIPISNTKKLRIPVSDTFLKEAITNFIGMCMWANVNIAKQSASDPFWTSFIVLRLIVSEMAGISAALRPETGNTAAGTQSPAIKPGRVPSRSIKK